MPKVWKVGILLPTRKMALLWRAVGRGLHCFSTSRRGILPVSSMAPLARQLLPRRGRPSLLIATFIARRSTDRLATTTTARAASISCRHQSRWLLSGRRLLIRRWRPRAVALEPICSSNIAIGSTYSHWAFREIWISWPAYPTREHFQNLALLLMLSSYWAPSESWPVCEGKLRSG